MKMEKAGECVREKIRDVADAVAGEATRRQRKQCLARGVCMSCGGVALLAAGCLAGIHYDAIKALILGERMPRAPHWHFWCR